MSSSQSSTTPRPTHVVTCFLQKHDQQADSILIVQRSQRVGSYHEHWAGISGFVEAGVTPEEQAYTEIREETGLLREQVQMLKRGAVVEYIDHELGRHWFVHPFLFNVLTPEQIKTDWEALEYRWIAPDELRTYNTVPKLWEAYQSAINGEPVLSS